MINLTRSLLFLCLLTTPLFAQNGDGQLDEIPIQMKLLPYTNPLNQIEESVESSEAEPLAIEPLAVLDQDMLEAIMQVYSLHLSAIEAQVQDDAISAERHINNAVSAIQVLMDEFPEIRGNHRFTELYRSVILEYREFFGITEPLNPVEGDILLFKMRFFPISTIGLLLSMTCLKM